MTPPSPTETLILGSQSPRRCELLRTLGYAFTVCSPKVEEVSSGIPEEVVAVNAKRKATAVAQCNPGATVIGSDTVVAIGNEILGKPADLAEAADFLRRLSGREHRVLTAIALVRASECVSWIAASNVRFKVLSESVITEYLGLVNVLDKAGAYAIQEHGDMIVAGFDGELETIVGLPLQRLRRELKKIMPPSVVTP